MKSAAASKVGEIEDLLKEILIRLPSKPLLKFKCVSKQWLRLISDPQFCASHFRFQQSFDNRMPTAILVCDHIGQVSKFQVIPLNSSPNFTFVRGDIVAQDYLKVPKANITQSCNGLLLCRSEKISGDRYFHYVLNPTTGKFKRIAIPDNNWRCVCLAFDPKISPHYKVIFFSDAWDCPQESSYYSSEICIYSSEIDAWTPHRALCTTNVEMHLRSSNRNAFGVDFFCQWVYINGELHWQIQDRFFTLTCFDVQTMTFNKKMGFPEGMLFCYFGESQGRLHTIAEYYNRIEGECAVIDVAADYSGWVVRYRFNLSYIIKGQLEVHVPLLSIICDKNAQRWIIVTADGDTLKAYNLSDGTHYRLCDPELKFANYYYKLFQYFENLICI